jgi:response regulator RpfG family c-di-GMP phosphodiesterase
MIIFDVKTKYMVLVHIKNDFNKLVIGRYLQVTGYPFQMVESEEEANRVIRKEKVKILMVELESVETNHLDFTVKVKTLNPCLEPVIYAINQTTLTYQETEALGYDFLLTGPLKLSELKSVSDTYNLITKFGQLKTRLAALCEGNDIFQRELSSKLVLNCKNIKGELKSALKENDVNQMRSLSHKSTTLLAILGVKELDSLLSDGLDYLGNANAFIPDQFYHDLDFTINSIVNNLSKTCNENQN